VRASNTLKTKKGAEDWATKREAEILAGKGGAFPRKTGSDALERYELEVSKGKRGKSKESLRSNASSLSCVRS
jgi:hypothetical protein